jgi:hypothetical protein
MMVLGTEDAAASAGEEAAAASSTFAFDAGADAGGGEQIPSYHTNNNKITRGRDKELKQTVVE